jgi:tetratricopeptide (TPR) repeat protein
MAWLRAESENWFAALQSAAAAGDHARVIDVAEAMHWFSDKWSYWGHWHEVYGLSSAAAHALGDRSLEAVHLNYLAWAYAICMGRYQDAIETATKALTIAAETGDTRQQAWAHNYIAGYCVRLGDYARAEQNAREALALMEAAEDREGYPLALMGLGDSLRGLGRLEEALDCHLRCVTLLRGPDHGAHPRLGEGFLGLSLFMLGRTYGAAGARPPNGLTRRRSCSGGTACGVSKARSCSNPDARYANSAAKPRHGPGSRKPCESSRTWANRTPRPRSARNSRRSQRSSGTERVQP